jgi:hypothetical protein
MTSSAARMAIVKCYLSQAMLDRLAPLADKAGRELGRTVDRAAVIRTALTAWLHQTKALPLPDVGQTIRRAMRVEPKNTRRRRLTVRWTEETARRLVDLTFNVRPWLHRAAPPSALVRAALVFWIDAAEQRSPDLLAQEILPGLEKRGRKKANFPRIPNGI